MDANRELTLVSMSESARSIFWHNLAQKFGISATLRDSLRHSKTLKKFDVDESQMISKRPDSTSKLTTRVRFPSPAPIKSIIYASAIQKRGPHRARVPEPRARTACKCGAAGTVSHGPSIAFGRFRNARGSPRVGGATSLLPGRQADNPGAGLRGRWRESTRASPLIVSIRALGPMTKKSARVEGDPATAAIDGLGPSKNLSSNGQCAR